MLQSKPTLNMSGPLGFLTQLFPQLTVFTNSFGDAMGDLVCIALFTLVDVLVPYVTPILANAGILNGLGGQAFGNFIQIFKLTMYTGYCKTIKMG